MTRDLRTLIYLLTPRRMLGPGMQSGSSSRSGHNRASSSSSGRNRGAAVEADANGGRAAAEADAIELFRELSGAGLRTVGEQGGSS